MTEAYCWEKDPKTGFCCARPSRHGGRHSWERLNPWTYLVGLAVFCLMCAAIVTMIIAIGSFQRTP